MHAAALNCSDHTTQLFACDIDNQAASVPYKRMNIHVNAELMCCGQNTPLLRIPLTARHMRRGMHAAGQ